MTIYKSKAFKPVFNYEDPLIKGIIILSNNSLLLYYSEHYSILNFPKSIKTTKMNFKYEIEDEDSVSFIKLKNKHILFSYIYKNKDDLRTRDDPNKFYNYYCFYVYDIKNSDLIRRHEDTQFLRFRGNFLPYEKSFFYYGNDSYFYYSTLPWDYNFIYFYQKEKKK